MISTRTARLAILGATAVLALAAAFAAAPARQAVVSWLAVTQDVEGNALTDLRYNVYRGARGSALTAKTKVAENLNGLTYTDSGRPPGVEECYVVTAVKGVESDPSAEGCKSYPAIRPRAPPGAPTVQ